MATTPLDLPILISQLPHLQQAMGPQHMPHDAQQVLFGQLVADNQRKDEQKVQTVEKEDGMEPMGRDAGGNKNAQQQLARQRHHPPPEPEPQPGTQSSNASPWTGNIINVKI